MWKCLNCGAEFEEPIYRGGLCTEPRFEDKFCPECEVNDIEELHICRCERKYITSRQDRCDKCEKEIIHAMNEAIGRVMIDCNVDHQQATEDIVWWIEREG